MKKLFFILFQTLLISCGSNKPKIVGIWDVYRYEMKDVTDGIHDFDTGDWVFEFKADGKLTTTKPTSGIGPNTVDYKLKNDKELWIVDNGRQVPYTLMTFTYNELVMNREMEVISLKRRH